eukprot:4938596-Alexandrium_andersonii.AAC.1
MSASLVGSEMCIRDRPISMPSARTSMATLIFSHARMPEAALAHTMALSLSRTFMADLSFGSSLRFTHASARVRTSANASS